MSIPVEDARRQIEIYVQQAYTALEQATKIADEHQIEFGFDVAYGMGGTYYPTKPPKPAKMTHTEALRIIESGEDIPADKRAQVVEALRSDDSDDWSESSESEYEGWTSSSSMC